MAQTNQSLTESYFDDKYRDNQDPWGFETSPYERDKYRATVDALPDKTYENAFEIGCSIGVLSQLLATRCTKLLAIDIAESAVSNARKRLADCPWVTFEKMAVPGQFPSEDFDLIIMSEVAYFFNMPDLKLLHQKITSHLKLNGNLLLVHWTPEVPEHPLTGDEVHDYFMHPDSEENLLKPVFNRRADTYRLDLFQKL